VSDILLFTSAEPSEFPFFNGKIGNVYAMYMCITFTCSCAFNLLSFQPCKNVLYYQAG